MFHDFRARLLSGQTLLGSMLTVNSTAVAEMLALAGLDWIFIDGEHGPFDATSLQSVLQATSHRCAGIVRVPSCEDETAIKRALDLGAAGIIAPQVNSKEQAEHFVSACRYPPLGHRGMGLARAHEYGSGKQRYVESANDHVSVVIQAEHADAVAEIESIVTVSGLDCVLIGPSDLAASLGHTGNTDHPQVKEAIEQIVASCAQHGMVTGIFGRDAAAVEPYVRLGVTMIVAGIDSLLMTEALNNLTDELKMMIGKHDADG